MGEQFYLKWNNHQTTLIGVFDSLLGTEKYADCILAAEGRVLRAHKVVLSACSPYLEYLLNQQGTDKHPILIFNDIKYNELKSMLDYMYKGEVNVLQDQFNSFLKAAKSLQVKGLTDQSGGSGSMGETENRETKKEPLTPKPPETARPSSPEDGSTSPVPVRKKRKRRPSQDHQELPLVVNSNSCDIPPTPVSLPIVTKTKVETDRVSNMAAVLTPPASLPAPPPAHVLQAKTEPSELILQPKTEYIESMNDDQPVEDLTLDDDEEEELNYMSNPGTSLGENSQDYNSSWQLGESGGESFLAAQEAMGNQSNSQDEEWDNEDGKGEMLLMTPDLQMDGRRKVSKRTHGCFPCEKCGRQYIRKDSLQRHALWECGKEPRFQCPFCPQKCKRKSHHIRHIQRQHKDMLDLITAKDPDFISDD